MDYSSAGFSIYLAREHKHRNVLHNSGDISSALYSNSFGFIQRMNLFRRQEKQSRLS
jgi:hypothetical protein